MNSATTEYSGKDCKVCKQPIEYLCDFPGPMCLACYEKKMAHAPLVKPNFVRAINFKAVR